MRGNIKVVEYCLGKGWDLLAVDKSDRNALHLSICYGYYNCALFLLAKAEELSLEEDTATPDMLLRLVIRRDCSGRLPLHYYFLNPIQGFSFLFFSLSLSLSFQVFNSFFSSPLFLSFSPPLPIKKNTNRRRRRRSKRNPIPTAQKTLNHYEREHCSCGGE